MLNKTQLKRRTIKTPAGKGQITVEHVKKPDFLKPMVLKVSSRGDAIIPREICKNLDLQPGDQFELIQEANQIILVPANNRPRSYGKIYKLAVKVFQDSDSATLWLNEPQYGLGGAIPVQHMKTAKGAKDVENLLGRIEYGVLA